MTEIELRDQMWDLIYGLLSAEESQALIVRIKSDPKAARLYSEVRLQADLVGDAARVEDPLLVLHPGAAVISRPAPAVIATSRGKTRVRGKTAGTGQMGRWLVGLAATALAALLAVGYFWPPSASLPLAANLLAIDVDAPGLMPAGLTGKVALRTYYVAHERQARDESPAALNVRVSRASGETLFETQIPAIQEGTQTVEIPGDALEPGVRLEVELVLDSKKVVADTALAAELPVQQETQSSYLLLEEPPVVPGKPAGFALWNFTSFSGKPLPAEQSQVALENLSQIVPQDAVEVTEYGSQVISGKVQTRAAAAPASESLAAQSQSGYFFREERGARSASQTALADSRAGAGKPAPTAGAAGIAGGFAQAENLSRRRAGSAEQPSPGGGERLALRQAVPTRVQGGQVGNRADTSGFEVGVQVVGAGQPIPLEVPDELAGRQLLAAAVCRGEIVAAQQFPATETPPTDAVEPRRNERSGQRIALELPPEADGRIDVALIDQSSQPQQLVRQQAVYRQPSRELKIEVPELKERFRPGEHVRLTIQVTDERGQPSPETLLGVRAWNEAVVQQTATEPVLLADAMRSGGASTPVPPLVQSGRALAKGMEPETLDSMTAVSDLAEEFAASEQIQLTSNRQLVQARYEGALHEAQAQRRATLRSIGSALIGGGGVLLLVVLMLTAWQRLDRLSLTYGLTIAAVSVLAGFTWLGSPERAPQQIVMTPQPTSSGRLNAPAAASAATPNEVKRLAEDRVAEAPSSTMLGTPAEIPPASSPQPAMHSADQLAAGRAPVAEGKAQLARKLADDDSGAAKDAQDKEGAAKEGLDKASAGRPESGTATALAAGSQAPASLVFIPRLYTDASGRATIEFTMPPVESEFRLLIDALGQGRVGSRQEILVCRSGDD